LSLLEVLRSSILGRDQARTPVVFGDKADLRDHILKEMNTITDLPQMLQGLNSIFEVWIRSIGPTRPNDYIILFVASLTVCYHPGTMSRGDITKGKLAKSDEQRINSEVQDRITLIEDNLPKGILSFKETPDRLELNIPSNWQNQFAIDKKQLTHIEYGDNIRSPKEVAIVAEYLR
jgi:hypothetical protein